MAGSGPSGAFALFGGSFNPPHVAHLAVAAAAAETAGVDRVIWMPAATSPHKRAGAGAEPTPEHRVEMTRHAVRGNPAFSVSDLELRRGGVSYTVDTLRALRDAWPEAEAALILGGDSLAGFMSWREPEEILRLARLLVYRRPGFDETDVPPEVLRRTRFVDAPALDLSSTHLRERLAAGRTVRYLVPDAVIEYAQRNGLYAKGRKR
jgi:nicotinate-nucleotide adenylyltransferase